MQQCKECGHDLCKQNKTGYCRSCSNKNPDHREKNSNALKQGHKDNPDRWKYIAGPERYGVASKEWRRLHPDEYKAAREKNLKATKGVRRLTDEALLKKAIYREQCAFNLAGCIDKVEGFELLKHFGMYDRIRNTGGVVRDHILSVSDGFRDSIDPRIISHPVNCRFISHKKNAAKSKRSDITLEELLKKIENWNRAQVT